MVDLVYERAAAEKGYKRIAGVDEAGRGPLAGPVVAAACIIPFSLSIKGIDDSKKLSSKKRAELFHLITEHPEIEYGIGIVYPERIDQINILQATFEAMREAAQKIQPDYLLVDGNQSPKSGLREDLIVEGDSKSMSIAVASIIAKVTRDKMMMDLHAMYEEYGFDRHMGYPTKAHIAALKTFGPCPAHRKSFGPVQRLCPK